MAAVLLLVFAIAGIGPPQGSTRIATLPDLAGLTPRIASPGATAAATMALPPQPSVQQAVTPEPNLPVVSPLLILAVVAAALMLVVRRLCSRRAAVRPPPIASPAVTLVPRIDPGVQAIRGPASDGTLDVLVRLDRGTQALRPHVAFGRIGGIS